MACSPVAGRVGAAPGQSAGRGSQPPQRHAAAGALRWQRPAKVPGEDRNWVAASAEARVVLVQRPAKAPGEDRNPRPAIRWSRRIQAAPGQSAGRGSQPCLRRIREESRHRSARPKRRARIATLNEPLVRTTDLRRSARPKRRARIATRPPSPNASTRPDCSARPKRRARIATAVTGPDISFPAGGSARPKRRARIATGCRGVSRWVRGGAAPGQSAGRGSQHPRPLGTCHPRRPQRPAKAPGEDRNPRRRAPLLTSGAAPGQSAGRGSQLQQRVSGS